MKLKIDWTGLVTALVKAALPFLAGAVGGIAASGNGAIRRQPRRTCTSPRRRRT